MSNPKQMLPAPILFSGDEPFWEATRTGRLLVKKCNHCGESHYYPRVHCPFCGSGDTVWQEVSGKGTVYSYSIVARSRRPLAPAIIELDEGVRISSVIADADVYALKIGDTVQVQFMPTHEGPPAPAFTTIAAEAARAYSRQALMALGEIHASASAAFQRAAVIGAGNMGTGITLSLLAAGLEVLLIDSTQASLDKGVERITESLTQDTSKGRINVTHKAELLGKLRTSTAMRDVADADVIIEAVWEQMALKKEIFVALDKHAKPGALLATNTSTLDVGQIASVTRRPESVVGLHFFNPAQVMKLLEVIRSTSTSAAALGAAKALAKRLGKTAIVVGICDGFVGNRLMIARERQASRLLLEGALPQQIDRVLREFGLPMGTFELQDMAGGIELSYRARKGTPTADWLIERLFELGRIGQRAGKGYYRYEVGKRAPIADPEVASLIYEASALAGIARRHISDQEIHDRLILPMINEGAKLIEDGIVDRASDIDLVWQFGYGWPNWKGGPMYYADNLGAAAITKRLIELHSKHGEVFRPAALLTRLAETGQRFTALPA